MQDAPLMLSVSGLRGLVGKSLTPQVAARYAAAFGGWLKSKRSASSDTGALVVLGRDSRPSGAELEQAVAAGLTAAGCRVTMVGIAATPSVAIMVEELKADGGVVITASHNPIMWNGIKALRHDGVAPPPEEAAQIIAAFNADTNEYPLTAPPTVTRDDRAHRVHVDRVLKCISPSITRGVLFKSGRRLKVVVDSVHGAGGPAAALLIKAMSPQVELIHLYVEPTGDFPHTPEPTRENLTSLCDAVKQHKADIGFAQDPDADRLAIVDETGRYIGEEYTLAIAVKHVLAVGGVRAKPGPVVANLSTSRMLDDIAASAPGGKRYVIRTPVGEASVAAAMRREHAAIGGEGNGGVIYPPVIYVRDSIVSIALALEMLALSGQPLSQLVAAIPRYAIVKDKLDLPANAKEILASLAPTLRAKFPQQKIDTQDGVRVDWADRWVHVRPSNTEPIIRIIAEAHDDAAAKELISEVRRALGL